MASLCRNPQCLLPLARFSTLPPPFPTFGEAVFAVQSEADPEKLAQIFHHQPFYSAHVPRHGYLYRICCRRLAKRGRRDLIERLLDHQISLPQPRNEGFWIRLIMLYSSLRMVDHAVRTSHQMVQDRIPLSEKSLCAILTIYGGNNLIDQLYTVFNTLPSEIGVSPGVKSYNLVLKAFCQQKDMESARKLLQKMENPDIESYNVLLEGYLKIGDGVGFDEILKEIKNKGLEHDFSTYNHMILRFCESKECVKAKKLFDEMVMKGVKPNSASYNMIIDGFSKVGDFESGQKVLEKMLADGCAPPCSIAYITLLKYMVKEEEFDSALKMFQEIMKRKWCPPFEAVVGLVNGLVKMSKLEAAKEVVEKMKMSIKGDADAADSWKRHEAALPL